MLCGLLAADVPEVTALYSRQLATEPIMTALDGWHCLVFARA